MDQPEDQVDQVRRALVHADVRALAERTDLPEDIIMAVVMRNGWDVPLAQRIIEDFAREALADLQLHSERQLFSGGNAGGGKTFKMTQRMAAAVNHGHHGVVACVS